MPSGWSPEQRLALVERLARRSGADSESFFDAHGLGSAYRLAGTQSSKRARINAALHAAKQRGDLDAVLAAAGRYLGEPPAESAGHNEVEGVSQVTAKKRIFLSHAYADKGLSDLLRNALILGGVPEARIFYSSGRGTGIPSGEDVRPYLQRSLQEAGLVIELLSETFLTRPLCLMELGGAWTLGTPTYPIVVPPLTRDEAVKQIGNVQMGVLGTDSAIDEIFDELHDRLANDLGIQIRAASWNPTIRDFKQQLPARLSAAQAAATPQPLPIPGSPSNSSEADTVTIGNQSVASTALGKELHAEATNNDTVEHSATVKATFYDGEGRIVGTADGIVNQLRPGGTKTLSIHGVPDHERFEVEIDTLF